jgi:hypothetical protein
MKPDRLQWWPCLLLLVSFSQALPQAPTAVDSGGPADSVEIAHYTVPPLEEATDGALSSAAAQTPAKSADRPYGWRTTIYPALAWVPIFGTSVDIPPLPTHPIGPGASGSTNSSINGAYFGGARVERGKWSGDVLFMWTALSAERKTPLTNVSLDFVFGDAHIGREVLPHLYLEGGFRRLALDLHATVGSDSAAGEPGYWDPLIGLTYGRVLGKKWRVVLHGDGGGFGVGSDVDVSASGKVDWQFVRHFGLAMGYGGMHFSDSTTIAGRKVSIGPTMHGPIFGFGLYF